MPVQIVTDSTSDLPQAMIDALGIHVVPLRVIFGEDAYRDRLDISEDEFYRRLTQEKVQPKTSQPSAGEFEQVYRPIVEAGDEIVSIHLSGKLSGTLNAAKAGAGMVDDAKISVVDTGLVSMGLGLVAIRVAKAARAGMGREQLVTLAEETARQTEIIFVIDTLEFLARGGRIGRASQLFGTLLSIKPILKIDDGEVKPYERVRTRGKAIDRIVEWAGEHRGITEMAIVGSPPMADMTGLAGRLKTLLPNAHLYESMLGPVVGTHGGPGVIGFAAYTGKAFDQ